MLVSSAKHSGNATLGMPWGVTGMHAPAREVVRRRCTIHQSEEASMKKSLRLSAAVALAATASLTLAEHAEQANAA